MLRYFPKSQYNALPDMFVTVDMLQILEQLMSIYHRLHIWLMVPLLYDLSKNLSQEIIGSAASTTLS